MVHLGERDVVLEPDHVLLLPRRLDRWLGQAGVKVAYTSIADSSLVKPPDQPRGRWTVRLQCGSELTVGFPQHRARSMETIHNELSVRALNAQLAQM